MVRLSTAVTRLSVGAVVSIVKEVTGRALLVLLTLSVTRIVQLSYVPSSNVELSGIVRVTVLSPDVAADRDELPQAPPYVMVPASVEEKV